MDKSFMPETNSYLKPTFSKLRLKRGTSTWYVRVINKQILQALNFQSSPDGKEFTVNVEIVPLCWKEISEYRHLATFRLAKFLYTYDKWWGYDSRKEAWDLILERVVPVFESVSDYATLYQTLEPYIHNRPEESTGSYAKHLHHKLNGMPLFWLCVALGKIEVAERCISEALTRMRDTYQRNLEYFEKSIADAAGTRYQERHVIIKEEYCDTIDRRITERENTQEMLKSDPDGLLAMAKEHEEKSLENLSKYIV